jgi:hypothetical protein
MNSEVLKTKVQSVSVNTGSQRMKKVFSPVSVMMMCALILSGTVVFIRRRDLRFFWRMRILAQPSGEGSGLKRRQ